MGNPGRKLGVGLSCVFSTASSCTGFAIKLYKSATAVAFPSYECTQIWPYVTKGNYFILKRSCHSSRSCVVSVASRNSLLYGKTSDIPPWKFALTFVWLVRGLSRDAHMLGVVPVFKEDQTTHIGFDEGTHRSAGDY